MNNPKNSLKSCLGRLFAVLAVLFSVGNPSHLFGQTAEVKKVGVYYNNTSTTVDGMYCNWGTSVASSQGNNRSFVSDSSEVNGAPSTIQDPYVYSALIEYDQPYPNDTPADNKYPNHCLGLCMDVYCNNKPIGGSTYSIAFPLQQVKFDIVKYYNGKNPADAENAPAVRTIDIFPGIGTGTASGVKFQQALSDYVDDVNAETAAESEYLAARKTYCENGGW